MIAPEQLIIGPAAGIIKTLEDVRAYARSSVTRITPGSYTLPPRIGNEPVPPGDVVFFDEVTLESGNAIGLKNMGINHLVLVLPEMVRVAHAAGKKLIVSIVGETYAEIIELIEVCFRCGADGVEINLACPNVHDSGKTKPLMCQDAELVASILDRLSTAGFAGDNLSIKVAPTNDEVLVADICHAIDLFHFIKEVVATNTEGGHTFVRDGVNKLAFKPPGSDEVKYVGGMAGKPLHDMAVSTLELYSKYLPENVRLIGVGGVFGGDTALSFLKEGASGVEFASALLTPQDPVRKASQIAEETLEALSAQV